MRAMQEIVEDKRENSCSDLLTSKELSRRGGRLKGRYYR